MGETKLFPLSTNVLSRIRKISSVLNIWEQISCSQYSLYEWEKWVFVSNIMDSVQTQKIHMKKKTKNCFSDSFLINFKEQIRNNKLITISVYLLNSFITIHSMNSSQQQLPKPTVNPFCISYTFSVLVRNSPQAFLGFQKYNVSSCPLLQDTCHW